MLTDLKADAEILPLNPPIETWVGHKVRMIISAYNYLQGNEALLRFVSTLNSGHLHNMHFCVEACNGINCCVNVNSDNKFFF